MERAIELDCHKNILESPVTKERIIYIAVMICLFIRGLYRLDTLLRHDE